jgi:hypothetical protein
MNANNTLPADWFTLASFIQLSYSLTRFVSF